MDVMVFYGVWILAVWERGKSSKDFWGGLCDGVKAVDIFVFVHKFFSSFTWYLCSILCMAPSTHGCCVCIAISGVLMT